MCLTLTLTLTLILIIYICLYRNECGANPNPNPDASRRGSMHFIRTTKYGTQLKHNEDTTLFSSTAETMHTHGGKK